MSLVNLSARDLTEADLSSHMGMVSGSGGLLIQFYYAQVPIESQDVARNGTYDTRLHVAKGIKGDRLTVATHAISEADAQRHFPAEWARFKSSEAVPTDGTPLHELPGVTQSMIAYLVLHNLRSIEDVAERSADEMGRLGLDAALAHKLATRWMAQKGAGAADIAEAQRQAAVEQELQRLRDRDAQRDAEMAEMRAMLRLASQGQAAGAPVAAMASGAPVPVDTGPVAVKGGNDDPFAVGGFHSVEGNDDLAFAEGDVADLPDPIAPARRRRV